MEEEEQVGEEESVFLFYPWGEERHPIVRWTEEEYRSNSRKIAMSRHR